MHICLWVYAVYGFQQFEKKIDLFMLFYKAPTKERYLNSPDKIASQENSLAIKQLAIEFSNF